MAKTKTAAATKSKTTRAKASAKSTAKKPAAKKAKAPAKKAAPKKKSAKAGEEEVTVDRRRGEQRAEKPAAKKEKAPKLERREKVNRRRQIDPTTCERDYSDQEVEFMNALDAYKRSSGRMFPTCSEVLEVVRGIGYVQLTPAELATIKASRGETEAPADVEAVAEAEAEDAFAASDELRVD